MGTVLATLIYVFRENRVLMLERAHRDGDIHSGKWNGLGGKLEEGETPVAAAVRELQEESGLNVPKSAMQPLGTLLFPEFRNGQHWLVWVFRCEVGTTAQPFGEGPEGRLHWVPVGEVFGKNLWEADREFLPYVLSEPARPFTGVAWYERGKLTRTWIAPLTASDSGDSARSNVVPSHF